MHCPRCERESAPHDTFCSACGARLSDVTRPGRAPALQLSAGLTPFVNRVEERRFLRGRFDQACDGEGQVVLLAGEAGIGKSRLMQVLRADLADTPHTWLETSAAAQFVDTPFYSWTRLLHQFLGWDGEGDPAARAHRLAEELKAADLDPRRTLPYIAPVLNIPVPEGYPPMVATPEAARKRLLAALTEWVLGIARRGPLVILLEDLHWADPSTLELQELLVQQGVAEPLLLLYTTRPQFEIPWPERTHHTQLTVNRLLKRHVHAMVQGVASRAALLLDVIDQLEARADGVPLFVEELTRAVIEAGTDAASEIPATLAESLATRIDRQGPEAKAVVQASAVCGREFHYGLIRSVHPVEREELDRSLRKLVDAELLYVRGFPPDATYTFKHALVHDAAYNSLERNQRQALHARAAAALREHYRADADEHPEVVALHYSEAGDHDAAIAGWLRAGTRAFERGALRETERHLGRGLHLLGALPEGPARDGRELELRLALGKLYLVLKGYGAPETVATYRRAREVGQKVADPDQVVALLMGAWMIALTREGPVAARPLADEVMAIAEESQVPWQLARGYLAQAITRYSMGDFAGSLRYALLTNASGAEPQWPVGINPGIVVCFYGACAAWHLGLTAQARALLAEGKAKAAASGRAADEALAYQSSALVHAVMVHELEASQADAQRALAACAREPQPFAEHCTKMIQGWMLAHEGQPEVGATMIRAGFEAFAATGQRSGLAFFLGLLVDVLMRAGQTAEALQVLDESESASSVDDYMRPNNLLRRAELIERAGAHAADVESLYQQATEIAREQGTKAFELRIGISYARWLSANGRGEDARELLAPLCARLGDDDTRDPRHARALLEELGSRAEVPD